MRPVKKNSENYEVMLRYMIFNIENAVASMDISSDVEHSVWIIDYRGFSIWSAPPLSFGISVVTTLMSYYPERLGLMVLYEPPTSLQFFWSALRPMLNSRTAKKILFLNGTEEHKREVLAQYVDLDQLETDFGGYKNSKYDHDTYWSVQIEQYKERMEHYTKKLESCESRFTDKNEEFSSPKKEGLRLSSSESVEDSEIEIEDTI